MERPSKDDRTDEQGMKSKFGTRGKQSKSLCSQISKDSIGDHQVQIDRRKKMAPCGRKTAADCVLSLLPQFQRFILVFSIIITSTCADPMAKECFQGPNFWCLNQSTESICQFTNKTIGLCGYTNKRCQIKSGNDFCQSNPPAQAQSPFAFNGGLTGVDENLFSYYILSLYWPPSSCPSIYNETKDLLRYFCSPYTDLHQPGSERLVLHGLWPTFSTDGNYQGWPQFCSSETNDWSLCHIDGDLCPWKNTSRHDFAQGNYEYCLARENISQCLVNTSDFLDNEFERLKTFAPGYLNRYNLFINHEWTKHGSCASSIFANNISIYIKTMLDLVDWLTGMDSLTYQYIQRYAGEKIGLTYLLTMLNQTAIVNCNSKCELEELWLCLGRDDQTGYPTAPIPCPFGARNTSDSCRKARCEYVSLPIRTPTDRIEIKSYDDHFLLLAIFLFIALKLILWSLTPFDKTKK